MVFMLLDDFNYPLILLRDLSDKSLHAKVPPHEGSLASGARHHHLLFAALLADLVALQNSVYYRRIFILLRNFEKIHTLIQS